MEVRPQLPGDLMPLATTQPERHDLCWFWRARLYLTSPTNPFSRESETPCHPGLSSVTRVEQRGLRLAFQPKHWWAADRWWSPGPAVAVRGEGQFEAEVGNQTPRAKHRSPPGARASVTGRPTASPEPADCPPSPVVGSATGLSVAVVPRLLKLRPGWPSQSCALVAAEHFESTR